MPNILTEVVIDNKSATCCITKLFDSDGEEVTDLRYAVTAVAKVLEGNLVGKFVVIDIDMSDYERIQYN